MVGGLLVGPAQAQNARFGPDQDKAIIARARPAVDRGVNYLKGHVNQLKDAGEAGISALAMIKAGVAHNDQALLDTIARFAVTFKDGGYQPETKGGPDTYEASVVCLALVNLEPIDYKPQIDLVAQYLMGKQMPNGAWDYSNRSQGDESMTQYALLALWEAENAGIIVRPEVWDHAARYFLSVESSSGSWTYHRDAPNQGETVSMSAAGVGSLLNKRRRGQQRRVSCSRRPLTPTGSWLRTSHRAQRARRAAPSQRTCTRTRESPSTPPRTRGLAGPSRSRR